MTHRRFNRCQFIYGILSRQADDEARKVGLDIEGFEHEITVVRQNGKTDLSNAKIISRGEAIPQ